ncbi:MAG: hypothetical protein AB3N64_13445 [Puniceicoccaceae bacterium]
MTPILAPAGGIFDNPMEDLDFVYSEEKIPAYIERGRMTKAERIKHAFENVTSEGLEQAFCGPFADLWLGEDLDAVNATLLQVFTTEDEELREKYRLHDHWGLALMQQFYHMYYAFGQQGTVAPGRLYPETERAMLEELWKHMEFRNDIHLARKSTWWMIGSENHDLESKVGALLSSQIFMNHPDFKDRVYLNLGTGGGYKYWFHGMYAATDSDGPEGRAKEQDGKTYTVAEHYEAWVKYFDEYFTERAKKGFFLEVASPKYMVVTITYLMDIFDLCEDEALAEKAGNFLDIVWADWAQDQINGVRGGGKTRATAARQWDDGMYKMARFYFGGKGSAQSNYFPLLLSKYELKPIIWHLALDREGLGEFAFASRRPGEEENIWPRPKGTERTMLCDTESRLLRYSWVTPDYILGGQMDHPAAVHSHLSNQARWQGITFKGANGPRVYPTDVAKDRMFKNPGGFCRLVQHENVMIVQQSRRWFQMNPDWFPAKDIMSLDYGIYFGDNLDRIEEKAGWIFVEHGDAFLAVRPVMGEFADGWSMRVETYEAEKSSSALTSQIIEDSYEWSPERDMIILDYKYSGMIFEASRRAHHATLEDFMEDILDNFIVLDQTVVPGYHVLRYRGCGDSAKEITFNLSNNEIPMLDGVSIDYAPELLFDSPYLKSVYKSGIVEITKGDHYRVLDFN